jgi:hypothetical protein
LKGKASKDPLGEREETSKKVRPRKATYCNADDDSNGDANNEPEYNNPESDNNVLFNSENNRSDDGAADKDIEGHGCADSGYSSDGINVTITEDTDQCYTARLDECG